MNGKLIFTKVNHHAGAFLICRDRLISAAFLSQEQRVTGGIYVGRVKDVVNHLGACFVEIQKDLPCFLPGSEMDYPCFLDSSAKGDFRDRRIKQGDLILVQGIREAQKTKQPAVTTKISLSNSYFVISLGNSNTGFSSKLSPESRTSLKNFLTTLPYFDEKLRFKHWDQLPMDHLCAIQHFPSAGIIVRTECEGAETEVLRQALEELVERFISLLKSAMYRNAFSLLLEPPRSWEEALSELILPGECEEIMTDDPGLYNEMLASHQITGKYTVRLYEDADYSLEKLYSLQTKLQEALSKRIWLKSGAYLIIEPTEALTVIDVNSGKYEAQKGNASYIRQINLEAADEIVRQIRLRNLSGMILIDFINMTDPEDQKELIQRVNSMVHMDRVKTCVIDFTQLGLMEITRQKRSAPLLEQAIREGFPLPKR